ncbi:MAG: phosphoribosylformylglycinamidine synthase subunit PurL, partial [Candidatus Freyarchaeota archaeon]|nr:phosphoribosylformylglycinamidine synthase subunit PurL [Candidatus Jordarchaeia archaeon]
SSKTILKQLPREGERVVVGPGYDAGVVDIGDGYVAVFKIESHNHPSALDPYNGAATGIGGIVRDVLCMGARPIALLDSLRFGPLKSSHSRWLLRYVVKGIGDYGNCIGVPTVAGEIEFDESFERNCLVNVVCVGIAKRDELVLARADRPGDLVLLVGGTTGRDGIHGVTFASKSLTEESEEDRPAVQVGDPFTKKLLIEATLEAVRTGFVHGLKDLGGGGLTCASSEMSYKGRKGMEIDISKVHLREAGMTPFEIMLSESQERMLFIVDPIGIDKVTSIMDKYELQWSIIGKVIEEEEVIVKEDGKVVARLPTRILADPPIIDREARRPLYLDELLMVKPPPMPSDLSSTLLKLLSSENIASKEWVYRQYDHEVGVRSVVKCGEGDAAVLRILGEDKGIAVTSDCNSKHCYLSPYDGGAGAVAEACRNIVSVGAEPVAIVDGLNFGNPEKPEIFWQFKEAVRGMADMCRTLNLPCVGGNVSFYNEDEVTRRAVKPSPIVVALGVVEPLSNVVTIPFKEIGDEILIVGETFREMGGSEYYYAIHGIEGGKPPVVRFELEKKALKFVLEAAKKGLLKAVHDCSKGGIAVALALMSIKSGLGANIDATAIPAEEMRLDELLFSESHSRFIISTSSEMAEECFKLAEEHQVTLSRIGRVEDDGRFNLRFKGEKVLLCEVDNMIEVWERSFPKLMGWG